MNIHTGPPFEGVVGSVQSAPPKPDLSERLIPALLAALKVFLLTSSISVLFAVSLFITDFLFGLIKTVIVYCRDRWIELGISVLAVETVLAIIITIKTAIFLYKKWGYKLWRID